MCSFDTKGSPGPPVEMSITKTSSALTIHWSEGDMGAAPVTGYVVEARPSDEGVWDSFIRLLPPASRSVSVPLERLRSGVSYEFRVIAVNRYGYGQPSAPSVALAAMSERPFYEEWWFLLVMALVGLILILVLVFTLLLHGHSTKYKACGTGLCFSYSTFKSFRCHNCADDVCPFIFILQTKRFQL
ncbi:PREDICTED: protein sidekick-1-like, partial [Poecilia mexicana]|uniref:protein sidekick-1-like n=1 Tax=Poecilia mexicana TaxID=48701 RepID=UPI00072D9346